jgi:integrase
MSEIIIVKNNNNHFNLVIQSSIAKATQVIEEYNSKNSKRAYEGDVLYFSSWYKGKNFPLDQIKKEHIITFIMDHVEKHKISTIKRRLASLSRFLQLHKMNNPCKDKDVLILLRKLTEKYGSSKAWGLAITLDILNDMIETCKDDGLIGIRDAALLLFGFSTGGRRRSEISSAMLENLTRNNDGNFIFNMGKSKTNKTGNPDPKPIMGRAAVSLNHWINSSGIKEGPLFRGVRKGGILSSTAICEMQICRIVKSRCEKAGYDPSKYTAHSLRSGFVTEGGKRGKPLGDIMALTGHRSVTQVMSYYQPGNIMNNSAAYLAG